jgi:PPOX class probable F420-dependent enzyme
MFSDAELNFILARRIAHLATADARGQPHVIPVCFAYVEGHFWIAIDEKPKRTARLKRLRNIEENPAVALVFDHYDEDWSRLGYVLVSGAAVVVEDGPEHVQAIEALRARYEQYRGMALEGRPAIRITPERVVSWGDLT